MSSIALRNGDICFEGGRIVIDPTLESEVRFVLAVQGRDDTRSDDPRGYWAAPEVGTLLWTRLHLPNRATTHRLIERDIRRGLEYLTTSGRASNVTVVARQGRRVGEVSVDITIERGEETLELRFEEFWRELGFRRE